MAVENDVDSLNHSSSRSARRVATRLIRGIVVVALVSVALVFATENRVKREINRDLAVLQEVLKTTSIFDFGVCLCRPDRDVAFEREDGIRLAASLYGLANPARSPALIIVHGRTYMGRRHPFFRVLAREFAELGYTVMTIDRAGFGESGDPLDLGTTEALDPDRDISEALDYLEGVQGIDRSRIYLVGHSGGVPSVMSVASSDRRVKKVVAIGPPRRLHERYSDPTYIDYSWQRFLGDRRKLGHGPVPSWYSKDLWLRTKLAVSDIERFTPYFASAQHKPLLLLDGERESGAERSFLAEYFKRLSEPKTYFTISNATHYCNTGGIRTLSIFDRRVVNDTVSIIDKWLQI